VGIEERIYEVKKRWLPVYFISFMALVVLGSFFLLMYLGTNKDEYLNASMLVFLFSGMAGFNAFKLFKVNPPKYKTMKVIECIGCGYKITSDKVERGDYINKEVGNCPKCEEGKLLITGIYREKIGKK